ncbi:titin-like [Huso huso]|uniref:Titin-like n=1 Tax=Huso huso TaxID=61971 RepID=A0ABR0ZJP2_HUSHU
MAENEAGVGPSSSTSRLIKCREPTSPPSAPTVVKVNDTTKTSVSLEWTTPVFDGGMAIIGYVIEMCKASLEEWHKVNLETCINTKFTVSELEPGEEYKFRVAAINGAGKGESCAIPNAVKAVDRLTSPEIDIDANFKQTHIVRAGGTICLHIAFQGRPVPLATWTKADSDLSMRVDVHTTETYSTLTVENCNRYDAGKYTLSLENNSGSKSITFTVKVRDTPGPPGPITFKDVTRGSVTVMWDAPANDGGARIHHYIVEKREASRRSWQEVSGKCSGQILRVGDLSEGVPYFFRVIAENEYGPGEACEMPDPLIATEEPAPPKRLDVIDTSKSTATLAWLKPEHDGGSRITGYIVEIKQKGSDKWVVGGQTKSLTLIVEGLVENTEYEFRVKARNDAGFSEPRESFSSVIIKEPQIEPTADLSGVTNQLITCKAGSSFTIDIPISGRPVPKVTWKLEEMKLKETDRVSIKTTKERTTMVVKESMRGDSGKYYLILENVAGVRTFTVTVNVIGRPGPATGPVEISSITSESCVLTWQEPEDDGGTEITNYIVEKRESGTTAWQLVNSSVKRTQIKVTHLTKYMEYTFRVCSENRFGVSKPIESLPIVAEHPFIPPSPPTRPEVYSVSANAMAMRWEEPYHDGGSKVTGYWIERKERNTILWVKDNNIPCFECHYRASTLVEGLEYQFRIYAMNAAGLSKASEASRPMMAQNPVDPPGKAEVTDLSRSTVSLKWTVPLSDGGSKIVGYIVERKPYSETGEGRWLKCNYTTVTDTCFTVTALGEGEVYEFRVIAKNGAGVLSIPSESTGPVTCKAEYTPPKAELDSKLLGEVVTIRAGSDLVLDAAVGGKPDPKVFWSKGEKELELCEKISLQYTNRRALAIIKFCDRYDSGKYTLTVKNASGIKTVSVCVKVLDTPGSCDGKITISRVTEEKCTVSWKIPSEDGGSPITHYIIERRETSRLNWAIAEAECKTLSCVVTRLIKNNEYIFRVRGVNKYGSGVPLESEPIIARNSFTKPSAPGAPEIVSAGKDHVIIEWLKPETDGGSEISNYLVDKREKKSVRWTRVNKDYTVYDTRLKITGLLEGCDYQFRATAVNAAGDSEPSESSLYASCRDPTYTPGAPSIPRVADTTKHSISLSWTRPMYDGGVDVLGYVLEIKEEGTDEWYRPHAKITVRNTEYTVTNLTSAKKYCFRVAAVNVNGIGEFSESSAEIEPVERIEIPDLELADDLKKTVTLRAGSSLRLMISVTGRPAPIVNWSKPGVDLASRGFIDTTDSYTRLIIEKVNRYDAGKYTIEAENPSGKKAATIIVKVYDTPGPPEAVKIKDITKDSVIITWDVPSVDGGAPVNNYIIERREASMRAFKTITTKCSKTLYRITGLTEGTMYYFRVLPENIYGIGEACETADAVLVSEVPMIPQKLEVMDVTKSTVTLAWEKPLHDGGSRLTGYVIEACKAGTDRWMKVANVKPSVMDHTIISLNELEQYLFRVRATNSKGASEPREIVTAVTVQEQRVMPKIDLAGIPQKTVNVPAGRPIELSIPISGRPPPAVIWYFAGSRMKEIDRVKIETTGKLTKLTVRETTIDDTGDYTLEVKNVTGCTMETIKVIILDKPGEPTGPIRIDELDATSVTISWDPPEKDGGATISGYVVEQRDAHRPGWLPVSESVTRTTFKYTRLTEGTEYCFRVAAANRFGIGSFLQSEIVKCKSIISIPGPPGKPEVFDISRDGMTVSWYPPEEDGGSQVTGYIIERKEVRAERWVRANKVAVTMTRYRSTGLIEGLEYEHRVTAINARGTGKPSRSSNPAVAMDPIEPPGKPQNPRVTDTTRTSVSLAWSPPDEEGGSKVSGYLIEMQKVDQYDWKKCNTTPTKICEYTLTHLPQGAEYRFRLIACNAGGPGEPADVPGTVKITEMLEYPDFDLDPKYQEGLVVRQGGVIRLSVPIKGKPYPVCKWTKEGRDTTNRAMIATSETCTELVIKDAVREDSGTYDLVLENKCGKKAVYIKVKVIGRPDPPEGPLEFDDIQARSVRVSWRAPADDGGSDILGYIIEKREVPKAAWCTVDSRVKETSLVVKGLKENVEYHFRATAENQFGISTSLKSKESVIPKTPLCPPEPPSNPPEILDVTKNSVSLSWSRPKDDGGSRVTGYYIDHKEMSMDNWVRHNKTHVTTTMYTVTGLVPDAEYQFRVVAQNDIGISEPGPSSDPTVCKDPFDKPSQPGEIDIISVMKDSITIHWECPECDGGKEIIGYWIEYRQSGDSAWKKCHEEMLKDRQFTMGGLQEATEYEFRIFAENETGISRPRRTDVAIKTKLSVGEAPSIRQEMQEVTTKLGDPAQLTCQIIGRPLPEIKWFRYGKELIQSRKYKMSSDGRNHSLTVSTEEQEDEGLYTCRAINDAGETETSGKLFLQAPPQFHSGFPLKDTYCVDTGTSLRLHVVYIGRPVPSILWFHGKKPLTESENVTIENTENYTHLVIRNVQRKSHAGRYKVQLSNILGSVDTVLRVEIQDKPAIPEGPIVVDALLKNSVVISWKPPADDGGATITNYIVEKREAKEGEEWHLVSSSISGTSCRIVNLSENAGYYFRVSAQNQYGTSEILEIPSIVIIKSPFEKPGIPAQPMSTGVTKDSCVVSWKPPVSDGGTKIRNYCLEKREKKQNKWIAVTTDEIHETVYSVKGLIEGLEYEFRVKCENLGGESDWSEVSEPIIPKSDVVIHAPQFKDELRNLNVKYQSNATFVCKITGFPKPVVKWFKQGKEILPDGTKIKVQEFKGGYYQLVITAVTADDSTVYQVRATNQGGSISATVSLDVEVPAKIHLPKHLEGMGAVHALRGEVISIKIPFSGRPDPVITWQKGQDLIDNNGYYQVIVTRSFTSLVFPNGVDRKDAGFYIVCAKNRFGIDQQTVELDVADVPDPPRGIKASDISRDSVCLTWCAPANDGGSKVTSYIIEKCATTAERWLRVGQARETRYTVINLFGKTSYQFRVIAENKFGQSQPSDPTEPVVTKEDKTRMLNYDEEVDETREISSGKAHHSATKELHNNYMIAEELGRGQFGIVHRCVEISSKKTHMAKFVKVKGADQALIKKEIATLNIVRHKNFLYLHESFESLEELVMIFEFISGVDIFERLSTLNFELSEKEIINYTRQVCEALEYLHSKSYGHFDIRPENIVYTTRKSQSIKIIDVGQAKYLKPGENLRIQFTAPEYCAPEIHLHDMVSTVTDMWSVGSLVYVLLSGLNPFASETNQQMIESINNAEYSFDDEAFKDVSLEALDFVDRLFVKERKNRMTAAEALEHPWLKQKTEKISTKSIKTLRHRRYYQSLVKKEWNVVVSAARIASGGAIRSQRGVTVAKVKVAPIEIGPVTSQIMHAMSEEGGHAKYVCRIENYDESTEVTWYYGVRQLESSDKYEISYQDGVAIMYVKDIHRSDDGTYRCKVFNDYGEASSYAELFVEGVREYHEYFKGRTVKKVKRRVDTSRLLERPPEFTLPLYNRSAYVGDDVRFGVTITVHPEPRVTWLKSGQKIRPGEDDKKYTFKTDKGLYQLIIHNVQPEDDTDYTVVARNRFGEDSCKARLTVTPHPATADNTMRPMFKRLLANLECKEGQSVRFELRVSGTPAPSLKWEKDGTPLAFGPQIEVIHEGLDYYVLQIRDSLPEDSGTYRVIATNSAGSASCQSTLKVERVTYTKREYKSKDDKEVHVQKQIDKTLRLAEILAGVEAVPLTPVAQQALREAAILYKPAVSTKKVQGEFDVSKEEKKKRAEEKRMRMPYDIPEPRVHAPTALEEDKEIKHFVPLSDMRWYKKLRDQYEMPEPLEKIVQKRPKRIRLSRWEQFYVMPLPRFTDQYKPKWRIPMESQDDLETVRPSRHRTPSPEYEAYYRPRRRSLGDLSDEELLLPVDDYLSMKRTEEERLRLEEELELGFSASPPSRSPVRFELSALRYPSARAPVTLDTDEEEEDGVHKYTTYRIPSRHEAGPSYSDLRQRHDAATYRPPRQKQRVFEDKEDEELLRPVATTQRIAMYKSEMKRMEHEEKTRVSRRERDVLEVTAEGLEVTEKVSTESTSVSRLRRRRRSLSPTYIELMRPVSELIRPRPRPAPVSHVETPERRSPTPERTRPRSPSPVSSERSVSRSERTARFDIFSKYESRKAALKTEKKYEVVSQQPFSLDHAPRITLRMRSHRVPCGQNTRFTLNAQAKPTAEVKWYHNGQEIEESNKIRFTNTSGVLTLEVLNCQKEDSGTYRVVCSNYKGEASDYATLDVSEGEYSTYLSRRKDEEPPEPRVPEMTKTDLYHVSSMKRTSSSETTTEMKETKTKVTEAKESVMYKEYASDEKKVKTLEVKTVEEKSVQEKVKTNLPARILTLPQSVTVSEGDSARFACDIDGEPAPSVTWMHAKKTIVSSSRHQVTTTQYKSTFEIVSVESSDEGNYTVVVENSEGKQEAQFVLVIRRALAKEKVITSPPTVKSPEPRVKSPEPHVKSPKAIKSPKRVKSPEPVTTPRRVKSPPTVRTPSAERVELPATTPPKIVQQLKAEASDDKVKMTCVAESSVLNVKEVVWYKDGKKLMESSHHQFNYSADGTYNLSIRGITGADQGEYACEIIGEAGVTRTSFLFVGQVFKSIYTKVTSFMEAKATTQKTEVLTTDSKPVFTTGLSDVTVFADATVKLTVRVTGEPKPTILWFRDGKTLSQGGKYELFEEQGSVHLKISKSGVSDSGVYKCTATNSTGSVSTSCKVTIQASKATTEALRVATKTQSVSASHEQMEVTEQIVKKDIVYEEVKTAYTETKVSRSQMTVSEGQKVILKANISGASNIKWVLNGVELANSEQYRYGVSGGDQTLTIKKVSHKEGGSLTCEAETEHGLVKCHFEITVTQKRSDAPSFIVQPKSQNVNEGQNVIITCEVTGEPSPEVEWLKDNMTISMSSNMKLSRSKNVFTLEIHNAAVADSGKYTVKAKNMYGQCSATASLNVLALVEEPVKQLLLEKSAAASMQEHFSSKSVHMAASMQESSFSSSSMSEVKFASMSASSMSSMKESVVAMSSSSVMGMSSLSHIEGSTSRMLKHGVKGAAPRIEALPEDISIEKGKVLTVACAFSGEPVPDIEWSHGGKTLSSEEKSGRFHVETTEDLTTLIITSVKENDAGQYILKLSNELGSDSATVNISIRSM